MARKKVDSKQAEVIDADEILYTDFIDTLDSQRDRLNEHLVEEEINAATATAADEDIDSLFSDDDFNLDYLFPENGDSDIDGLFGGDDDSFIDEICSL